MMAITKYDRVFRNRKAVNVNDVYDVLISANIPYMDAVITENHQSEMLKQSASKLKVLENIERYTLKDLK